MDFFVSSLSKVTQSMYEHDITHVISLLRGDEMEEVLLPPRFNRTNWLRLDMDDVIDHNDKHAPKLNQIIYILDWTNKLPKDSNVLVHCHAGISRSTAVALMLKVRELGVDRIPDAVKWLVDHRPIACPNPVITDYADQLLGANGKLFDAAETVAKSKLLSLYGDSDYIVDTLRNHIRE